MPALPKKFANVLMKHRHVLLASAVAAAIAIPQISSAFDGTSGDRPIMLAQKEDPKKKKEKDQPRKDAPKKDAPKFVPRPGAGGAGGGGGTGAGGAGAGGGGGAPKGAKGTGQQTGGGGTGTGGGQPSGSKGTGGAPKGTKATGQGQQGGGGTQPTGVGQPKVVPKLREGAGGVPKGAKGTGQGQQGGGGTQPIGVGQPKVVPKLREGAGGAPGQDTKKKFVPRETGQPDPKSKLLLKETGKPKFDKKGPPGGPVGVQTFGKPKVVPGPTFGNVKDLRDKRKETRDKSGRVFIVEPGGRRIMRDGKRVVIFRDDSERMRRWGGARFELRGQERYTIVRRGDFDIITVTDANGRLLRRFRRGPDGREYVLIDNRRRGIGVGVGVGAAAVGIVALGLMAPRITIPRERYIVDAGVAPPAMLFEALEAPPLMPLERAYTLDEIRDNVELRDYMRSVDINTINFSSGAWEVSEDQVPRLQALAEAIMRLVSDNPSTVIMLEGHTDAVGNAEDNLSLSDRRAESVAEALTTHFQVPPENLVTQGYGEQYLRVQTDGPSRENRRVVARNITPLLSGGQAGGPPDQPPG